ncbi:hypothetical protein [Archaeoglobus sp.]|nr:hypothetical protein [Archaeoglobus sp.]
MGQPPEVSHSEAAEPAMKGGVTLGADFDTTTVMLVFGVSLKQVL